jgi:hypothetical protein
MFGILLDKLMPRKEHYSEDSEDCKCKNDWWITFLAFYLIGSFIALVLSIYSGKKILTNSLADHVLAFFSSYIYIFIYLFKFVLSKKSSTSSETSSDSLQVGKTNVPASGSGSGQVAASASASGQVPAPASGQVATSAK